MPDIFDTLSAPAAKPQGDIFDQVHSQLQTSGDDAADRAELDEGIGPNHADPSRAFNQANAANQKAQANVFEQARQKQATINAQSPLKNAWNAFAAGTSNLIGKGSAQVADYLGNNVGDSDTDQETADRSTLHKDMANVQQFSENTFPNDPNRMSGKVGHAASAIAPSLVATATGNPELVPAIMAAQGMENAQENIDAVQSAGGEVSHGQNVTNTLAQGGLGAAMGYLAPGGTASKSLIGALPKLANPVLNAGKNALVAGAVAAPEMGLFQTGSNAINMATGTETPEQQAQSWQSRISQGVPEASLQGLALGAGGQVAHEVTGRVFGGNKGDVFDKASNQSESSNERPVAPDSHGVGDVAARPEDLQAASQPEPAATAAVRPGVVEAETPYDFAALRSRVEGSDWRNVPEKEASPQAATDDVAAKAVLAEGGHTFEQPTESEPTTDKRLAERRITQTEIDPATERREADDRRFEGQAKSAEFQTPEEAAPNLLADIRAKHEESVQSPVVPSEESYFDRIRRQGADKIRELATSESGMETGVEPFVKQDVIPTIQNITEGLKDATTGLRHTFGLQEGKDAGTTKDIMKERGAKLAQRTDQVYDQFNKAERWVGKIPEADQLAITHAAETGAKQPTPALQSLADLIRDQYDDRLDQIQKRDPNFQGIEDYMAHDWKDPRKAGPVIADALKKRPLAGKGEFRKQRVFMTQEEGIAAGLEPKSTNPVEQMRNKLHSMDRWITAFDAKESMDQAGLLRPEPKTGRLPDGYSKVNDPMFKGQMVPDAVASVLNNVLTPGISGHPQFGAAFRGTRIVANMMNEAQLSLSGMHVVTSSINSSLSDFALGLKQAIEGKPIEGAKKMGMGLVPGASAVRDYMSGTKMLKEWLKPGTTDPETALIVEAMKKQGGRATMDSYDRSGMSGKMMEAFRNGNPLGALVRAPFAAIEQAAKPIMKYLVPRLKMGSFMQAAQTALESHPGSTAEELSGHMGDAWRSIDNRFGQMVHDNRFWTQTMRHLSHMTFRSVGWNYGTLDEMGGGALDFARAGKDLASGKGADFTHRMAYTVALPTLIGTWGAVLGYAMTGQAPQSIKDLYYPKTGSKDKDGRDVRIALPTYMRDVFSAGHNWTGTVASKLHPLIGTTLDFLANKDFQGNKVYNEDDKGQDIIADVAKHFGKSFVPINLQQYVTNKESGSDDKGSFARTQLGVSNAPKWVSTSSAEQEAYRLIDEANNKVGGRTKEAAALRQHESDWVARLKQGEDEDHVSDEMEKDPQMSEQRAKSVFRRAREQQGLPGLIADSQLGAHELLKVWGKATEKERTTIKDGMEDRLDSAGKRMQSMAPADQEAWNKLYETVTGEKP